MRPILLAGGVRRRRNGQVAGDSPRVHAHVLLVERPRSHSPLARRGCGTPLPWLRPFHVVTPAGNQRPHFINGFGTLLRPFNNANGIDYQRLRGVKSSGGKVKHRGSRADGDALSKARTSKHVCTRLAGDSTLVPCRPGAASPARPGAVRVLELGAARLARLVVVVVHAAFEVLAHRVA